MKRRKPWTGYGQCLTDHARFMEQAVENAIKGCVE